MRRKTVVGVVLAMTAASLLAAWAPAIASAAGGKSIATAPLVTYGQQEFGNTAEDQYLEESCGFADAWRSYWSLPVTAGDLVTINWEGSKGTELKLAPLGTTDFTLFSVDPALSQELSSNGKAQAQYTVPQSGTMPLYFRVCSGAAQPGPYNFIATAQHGLAVSLTPPPSTIQTNSVLTGTARLASGAAVPDGLVFTLSAVGQFGTATYTAASSGGALSFPLALPATAAGQSVAMTISRPADADARSQEQRSNGNCGGCASESGTGAGSQSGASPEAIEMLEALQEAEDPRQGQVRQGRQEASRAGPAASSTSESLSRPTAENWLAPRPLRNLSV